MVVGSVCLIASWYNNIITEFDERILQVILIKIYSSPTFEKFKMKLLLIFNVVKPESKKGVVVNTCL